MELSRITGLFVVVLTVSCMLDPEDRCLKGFTYDEDILSCRKNPSTDSDSNTGGDTESDFDAGPSDGGALDSDTGPDGPTGMGEACTASGGECASFEANYCLYDPTNPTQGGVCTVKDCAADECPSGYQCCNAIIVIACMPDDAVDNVIVNGGSCPP